MEEVKWWPSESEYDPGITKERWLEMFPKLIGPVWGGPLAMFYLEENGATCAELAAKYPLTASQIIARCNQLAQHAYTESQCPLVNRENGEKKTYWPILFVGRHASAGQKGSYVWKLRPELREALTEYGILRYLPNPLNKGLRKLVSDYKTLIRKTNYTRFLDDEIYKWRFVTDNQEFKPLEIVRYLVKKNINLYDRTRDSMCWKKLLDEKPKQLEEVILRLADESVDLHIRLQSFKKEMKELLAEYGFNSYANDERTASCFLTCLDPSRYTIYKDGNLYDPLCRFLEIKKKDAGEKYEHFLSIAGLLANIVHDDSELQDVFARKTKGLIQSDLMIAQTVVWCVFESDARRMLGEEPLTMIPEKFSEYVEVAKNKKNIILQGAPGTGKTYSTAALALCLIAEKNPEAIEGLDFSRHADVMERYESYRSNEQIAFCTFHQSMDYEDFVQGLRPEVAPDGSGVVYKVQTGIFKTICQDASDSPDSNYVLIIDEINRGNVSKIFGELITLLEKDKRSEGDHPITLKLPYSGKDDAEFSVPSNLFIVGTMNTTDRSTGTLDYALRRRFDFITLEADESVLDASIPEAKVLFRDVKKFINNNRLDDMDISDLMIGHSYFISDDPSELRLKVRYEIIPLVREYIKDGILNCLPEDAGKFFDAWEKLLPYESSVNIDAEGEGDELDP